MLNLVSIPDAPKLPMIRLRALGQCVFEIGSNFVTPESDVLFAILLLLSSRVGQRVGRSELLDILWPDTDSTAARHRLRQALYQLKKLGAPLATEDGAIFLRKPDVEVDYDRIRDDRRVKDELFGDVGQLEVLPRYSPSFSAPFAEWLQSERERVAGRVRRQLFDELREHSSTGSHDSAIRCARACLELDPLNAEATFVLAESYALLGAIPKAVQTIDWFKTASSDTSSPLIDLRRRIVDGLHSSRRETLNDELVGRASIVRELDAWLRTRPTSRILSLVGEAGIGKTRLLAEARRIARLRGRRCIEYRPGGSTDGRPLGGLLDLLPHLLSQQGAVGCDPDSFSRLQGVTQGVSAEPQFSANSGESDFRFALLRRSVLDLCDAILSEGDVVLLLDDGHTIDRLTLEILLDATRASRDRLSIAVALRPVGEAYALLQGQSDVRWMRVSRLSDTDSRLLLTRELHPTVVRHRQDLINWALELANGHPFFLAELSAHCKVSESSAALPESIQIALERRLDALSGTARLLLQACTVLGKNASLGRLELLLAAPAHLTAAALSELESAELICFKDGTIGCRHELIADAVVRTLGVSLGTFLHRRCAIVLDGDLRSSQNPSLAWDCVRHWEVANEPGRALALTALIVDQLLSLGLPNAAVELCGRAEGFCRNASERADLLVKRTSAHRMLCDWDGVVRSINERRSLLTSLGVRWDVYSDEEVLLTEANWWRNIRGRSIQPVVARVRSDKAPTHHRLKMAVLALIVADNQHSHRQANFVARTVETLEPKTESDTVEKAKALLIYHTTFGSIEHAIEAGRQVVDHERQAGHSAALLRALRWLSSPLKLANDVDGAMIALSEAFDRASSLGLRADMWSASQYIQWIALDCEDLALAEEWSPVFSSLVSNAAVPALRAADFSYFTARIAYAKGEVAEAWRLLESSRALLKSVPAERGEQSIVALDLSLQMDTGRSRPSSRLVNRLQQLHLRTRDGGTRDFEAGVLFRALNSVGRNREAKELLRYYLSVRRTQLPYHSSLRKAIDGS